MGKPGAYLEIERKEHGMRDVRESLGDYAELALPLLSDVQRLQASRCMYCGVAFCQAGMSFGGTRPTGCPLHNLIPEWNDLVTRGLWDEAVERLSLTNPFPEFTGRVCPAPCEAACNLGLHDGATTIRDNERAISDFAWSREKGAPRFAAPAVGTPSVAVVGTGPAGLACAWELARCGVRVTLLERDDRAGGLLMYGIPNMKLPKDVVDARVDLMCACGIDVRCGVDVCDAGVADDLLDAHDAVVLAVGARHARELDVPGSGSEGVVLALDYLTAATRALLDGGDAGVIAEGLDVVVIGGGDTGTDCVAMALRQGAASVTQLEFLPEPPAERAANNGWPEWPRVRKDDYGQIEAAEVLGCDPRQWGTETLEVLTEQGRVCGIRVVSLDWSDGRPQRIEGTERVLDAQLVLLAMGFDGPESAAFEAFGAEPGDGGHRCSSSGEVPVYAAGDCRGGASLVVTAIADGLACAAEVLEGLPR